MGLDAPSPGLRPQPQYLPPLGADAKVLVIAHVYDPELWPDLAEAIGRIPTAVDLRVSLVDGKADRLADSIAGDFPGATTTVVPNHGRDILPFLQVLQEVAERDYSAILKLHTKASSHRLDGRRWRTRLLDSLCPSPDGIAACLALLQEDRTIGLVAAEGGLLGREFWGGNAPRVDELAARSGVAVDLEHTFFPGGSMFWMQPSLAPAIRGLHLGVSDFEPEPLPIDGTTAHAVERLIGILAHDLGLQVIAADEVPARLAAVASRRGNHAD